MIGMIIAKAQEALAHLGIFSLLRLFHRLKEDIFRLDSLDIVLELTETVFAIHAF